MKTSTLLLHWACIIAVGILFQVNGQVTFSGNVTYDFDQSRLSDSAAKSWLHASGGFPLPPSPFMETLGFRSGLDILGVYFQYDYIADILYVGVDCDGICGDVDGDGNPGSASDPRATDHPTFCKDEQLSLMIWPEAPDEWWKDGNILSNNYFFPSIVIGVDSHRCVDAFGAFLFTGSDTCGWDKARVDPSGTGLHPCVAKQRQRVTDPGKDAYSFNLTQLALEKPNEYNFVPLPNLYLGGIVDAQHPDIEFSLGDFSQYKGFNFQPGIEPIAFGFSLYSASESDSVGEDFVPPYRYFVPCTIQDACGECNGDNSTCADCFGVPNGPSQPDVCGVCGGDNSTCKDCAGVPNGDSEIDICGECGGDGTSCLDCFGVPHGSAKLDKYGICNGTNFTYCDGDPFSGTQYDECGVCGGDGTSCQCEIYLGYDIEFVEYALLRWSISASITKISEVLKHLYSIKNGLPYYSWRTGSIRIGDLVDELHDFCDSCLDSFDSSQVWFADLLAAHCEGRNCTELDAEALLNKLDRY